MEWLNYHHLLYFWTVVREGSVIGTQFHPEKSGAVGALLLAAWFRSLA